MHHIPALASQPVSLKVALRQAARALSAWGRCQWLALCARAERPGRQVPYY